MVPRPAGVTVGRVEASDGVPPTRGAPWRLATGASGGMVYTQQSSRLKIGLCRCHSGTRLGSIGRLSCKRAGARLRGLFA